MLVAMNVRGRRVSSCGKRSSYSARRDPFGETEGPSVQPQARLFFPCLFRGEKCCRERSVVCLMNPSSIVINPTLPTPHATPRMHPFRSAAATRTRSSETACLHAPGSLERPSLVRPPADALPRPGRVPPADPVGTAEQEPFRRRRRRRRQWRFSLPCASCSRGGGIGRRRRRRRRGARGTRTGR